MIHLRAIEPEDLDLLYRIENDRTLWNVGTTNVPYSRYTLHDYLANSSDDAYADRQVRLVVELRKEPGLRNRDSGDCSQNTGFGSYETGEVVGMVDLVNFDPKHMRAEAGIVILDECRRKGYATEALVSLCRYASETLHLHQLYAIVSHDNEAALNLFSKAGFMHGVQLREWLFDGKKYHDAWLLQRFL